MRAAIIFIVLLQCQLWCSVMSGLQAPKIDVGVSGVVPNITLYGGVIVNEKKSLSTALYSHLEAHSHIEHNKTHIEEILHTRQENIKNLTALLPFELLKWSVINTKPCPNYQHTGHNRLERGQGMSHMQIWLEFVFFDVDVLDARVRKVPEYITSNDYSSVSGIFQAVENGSLYKNKIPFLDEDIMIVVEDTAVLLPTITSNRTVEGDGSIEDQKNAVSMHMKKVLSNITADITSLGVVNTPGRQLSEQLALHTQSTHLTHSISHAASPRSAHTNTHNTHNAHSTTVTPLDAHHTITTYAYAITRAGAKKLIACYDHCGHYLEDQMRECVEGELVTHAHAAYPLFTLNA